MPTYSDLHLAARNYALAGIPVFPVEVNGKKPVTPNGFYDATTDLEQIDAWWSQAEYNIAFSPGDAGLTVLDLDPGHKLERVLPDSYTVKTPRGLHLYFEGISRTTASVIAPHVDTRSNGGYVLLPPSRIDLLQYTVLHDAPYAPLPQWIIDGLAVPEREIKTAAIEDLDLPVNVSRATDFLVGALQAGEVAIEGAGGDQFTYWMACSIRDFGLSEEKTFELLANVWNPHCQPPWAEEELQLKVINAYSYGQNETGAYAIEPPQKVFGALVAKLFPIAQSRFHFKEEEEFENEPDPEWLIKDLLVERSTVLLFGPTSSYKSFLALDIALSLASGQPAFGSETVATKVFYCALEGRAHLRKATRSWRLARSSVRTRNFLLGRAPIVGYPEEIQAFMDEISKRTNGTRPGLIVIDTLGKAMAGLNENDAKDAGRFVQFCDFLVEKFECSVLVIHHSGKDLARGARGSSAFHAGFDTVIEVIAKKGSKAVAVHVRKHKDAEERSEPFTFEGRVIGPSLAFFPTDPKEHKALTHEESEYSPRKIGAALQKLGAYGAEKAITTAILAQTITERYEQQSEDQYQNALARASRALHKASKDFLEAYTVKVAKITKWCLPGQ